MDFVNILIFISKVPGLMTSLGNTTTFICMDPTSGSASGVADASYGCAYHGISGQIWVMWLGYGTYPYSNCACIDNNGVTKFYSRCSTGDFVNICACP